MNRFILISGLVILVLFSSLSLATIPKVINYQGMLTDNSGTPLSGSYNLTFTIWTDTTGGSSLWTETQNGVQVQNGLFNVILGKVSTLNLAFDQQYWLEVAVGAETMPRIRFTSVGYAYRAEVADSSAKAGPTGGGWTDDGAVVRLTTSSDNVGIGTTNPDEEMEIYKDQNDWTNLKFNNPSGETNAGSAIYFYEGGWELAYIAAASSGNTNALAGPKSLCIQSMSGPIHIRSGTNDPVCITPYTGKAGIGTDSPSSKLHVSGSETDYHGKDACVTISNTASGGGNWHLRAGATGTATPAGGFSIANDVGYRVFIDSSGNVSIGPTAPSYKLDVSGAAHASSFPTSSDARLKKNVTPLTNVLEKLERIRGVSFDWNEKYESMGRSTGHREIGVIAQEVEAVFPELVTTWGEEEYRAVDYGRLTGVLIEAIKELKTENEGLKKRIEVLEAK